MSFHELESVALDRDLPEHDLQKGDVGVVVQVYGDDALEVEFMRYSGDTQVVITVAAKDVRAVGDEDVPAVRKRGGSRR